jgi:DNA polymerase-4
MRVIFHLDLDAFFISVERILDPSLINKPVIVGGDPFGRGVVAACSYESRVFGIHSAMPIRTAYKLCPHGVYLHGSFKEYVRYSGAVKTILSEYAPVIEQASIDEFYMDFTGCRKIYGHPFSFAAFLQKQIFEKLSLPSSIGIGVNKNIAKIGSDCMKPMGITYIMPGYEKEFLDPMPIETIPGVGKVTLKELNARGFYKIKDISEASPDYFSAAFGKAGIALWRKANGEGTEYLSVEHEQKGISSESTYGQDVISKEEIKKTLFHLTAKICQQMRDQQWLAGNISIKLRYSDFNTITRAKTIPYTDEDHLIFETAWDLIQKAYTRRIAVRLIGVRLTKFVHAFDQEELFVDIEMKRKKMIKAVNLIRGKYGFKSIQYGTL